MQQRQPRLGDILDDYCPRERRVTNHAVVAMVGEAVKQTRCTTCDADHEYKHAKVPRQRRKDTPTALQSPVLAGGPKRVVHDASQEPVTGAFDEAPSNSTSPGSIASADPEPRPEPVAAAQPPPASEPDAGPGDDDADVHVRANTEEGPAHRRLIRATLPRIEGQPPPTRPGPDFTIRQPNNRQRFRNPRGMSPFHNSNRSGNVSGGGDGMSRQGGRRPPIASRPGPRHGHPPGGRKRSK